jgi:hypothetical protein
MPTVARPIAALLICFAASACTTRHEPPQSTPKPSIEMLEAPELT